MKYYTDLKNYIESITPIRMIEANLNKEWKTDGLAVELSGLLQ